MRNIILMTMLAIPSVLVASPNSFTELFPTGAGYWTGEAKYYDNKGHVCERFFYAVEIATNGKTLNTLDRPGASSYQHYSLTDNGLDYDLKFSESTNARSGELDGFRELDDNGWEFSKGKFAHQFIKISDSQMLMKTSFNGKKHAKVRLYHHGWAGFAGVGLNYGYYNAKEKLYNCCYGNGGGE